MDRAASIYRITITNVGREIGCDTNQTILECAIAAGVDYPYACASGNCGTCVSALVAGEVAMLPRSDGALSPEQVDAGRTLACRARPLSDVTITWLGRRGK